MRFRIIYTVCTQDGDSVVLILNSALAKSFELIISLAPVMCFWCGIMEIADKSGITNIISRLLSPLTAFLFGKNYKNTPAMKKISMNMSANMLGMGNAATPLGIEAMKLLDDMNNNPAVASNAMCMFIVINTASIQLIPSSVIALLTQYGSKSPSTIIFPTMVTTLCAFFVGTMTAKLIGGIKKHD